MQELIEIGWLGKAHGLKGEIKAHVQDFYQDDLINAASIHVGDPPVPYFLDHVRAGGAIILKIEGLDSRESIDLLSRKPLYLMGSQVNTAKRDEQVTPFEALIGYTIEAADYPALGPITGIVDLPSHYLAELSHEGKEVLIPLHEDLITSVDEERQVLRMDLPTGLLD